jgi:NitT/TauT family transport system ATP-binding protein
VTDIPAIRICDVSHAYVSGLQKVETLDRVSLDVTRGEMLCLIGPSGCGKSTLLNIIGGLIAPSTGYVEVNGVKIEGPSPGRIAYVFQENTLFPWSTVRENILVGLEFQGVPQTERLTRADEALADVGLLDFANHYPHQLSGGMKQRASLARALSLKTDVLLMDEPFAALDEQTRMYLGEELSALLAETKKTIVLVTHSLSEAVFLSDRIVVMSARPAAVKTFIEVNEAHPRDPSFMASPRYGAMRNELYALLRGEVEKTIGGMVGAAARRQKRLVALSGAPNADSLT